MMSFGSCSKGQTNQKNADDCLRMLNAKLV